MKIINSPKRAVTSSTHARAVRLVHHYMPKGYVEVDARDFIENPEEYGVPGEWIWREVES